jgi:hypothetical protein
MIVSERRTRLEFAACLKRLVDECFLKAERIVLVLDNLNTHSAASLYEAFPAAEAHRIASKLEWHFTPNHGSWLNAVEIEFAALSKQCLDRRVSDVARLESEGCSWVVERNACGVRVEWWFRTVDARVKLVRLYPANPTRQPTSVRGA